ncbi:MAG: hypothetical protein VX347_01125 [Bacteroidota bacterium]|nr:hypothetical protein [Bacteroidota bacterium]
MKKIYLAFLSLFIISSACKKEVNNSENLNNSENPTVHFHHPSSSDMPAPGDTVSIIADITDNNHIHKIFWSITPDNNNIGVEDSMFFNATTTEYHLDTFFIANLHSGMMANYTITISAYDDQNNMGSASVTFHVMDSGNGTCSTCGGTDCGCNPSTCQCSMGNCSCSGG